MATRAEIGSEIGLYLRFLRAEMRPKGKLLTPFNIISLPIMAVGAVLVVIRFAMGLGSVTNLSQENRLLPTMVFIADTLCCHDRVGFYLTATHQAVDNALLESVGLTESDFSNLREKLPEQIEIAEATLMG